MTVYIVEYCHRHGQDFKAFATHATALAFCASICDQYAAEAGDAKREIRALYEEATRLGQGGSQSQWLRALRRCVDAYLDECDDESLIIHDLEVQP